MPLLPSAANKVVTMNDKLAFAGLFSYTASLHITVSPEFRSFIDKRDGLREELDYHQCTLDIIYELCFNDQQFGGFVFDEQLVAETLSQLRGKDASQLYDQKRMVEVKHEETSLFVQVPASPTNRWGRALLGFISLQFNNRIKLIEKSVAFFKILFKHLIKSENLWIQHWSEFTDQLGLFECNMAAFACDLPTETPDVGDFDGHIKKLRWCLIEIHEFLKNSVGPAYYKVKDTVPGNGTESAEVPLKEAPMATAAAGGGSGLDEDEVRKGKRKMG